MKYEQSLWQEFIVPETLWPLILIIAALAVILALLFWVLGRLRKSLQRPSAGAWGSGWTMEQINRLHQTGQLTDKQYQTLCETVMKDLEKSQTASH